MLADILCTGPENIPFVGRGTAKRQGQTNDETENGQQNVIDPNCTSQLISILAPRGGLTVLNKSRNARNQSRPKRDAKKRKDQSGHDTAMQSQEDGPF